jgi:hypothetical protein
MGRATPQICRVRARNIGRFVYHLVQYRLEHVRHVRVGISLPLGY